MLRRLVKRTARLPPFRENGSECDQKIVLSNTLDCFLVTFTGLWRIGSALPCHGRGSGVSTRQARQSRQKIVFAELDTKKGEQVETKVDDRWESCKIVRGSMDGASFTAHVRLCSCGGAVAAMLQPDDASQEQSAVIEHSSADSQVRIVDCKTVPSFTDVQERLKWAFAQADTLAQRVHARTDIEEGETTQLVFSVSEC